MNKSDVAKYKTFSEIKERLDTIGSQVKGKEVSLEQALDLFDEAVLLGSKIVDLVDKTDFTEEEQQKLTDTQDKLDDAVQDAQEPTEKLDVSK